MNKIQSLNDLPHSLIIQKYEGLNTFELIFELLKHLVNIDHELHDEYKKQLLENFQNKVFNDLIILQTKNNSYLKKDLDVIFEALKLGVSNLLNIRLIVIDDVDKLDSKLSNALLKVVEEPGLKNWIIMFTKNFDSLIDTIKSRCIYLNFIHDKIIERSSKEKVLLDLGLNQQQLNDLANKTHSYELLEQAKHFLKLQTKHKKAEAIFQFQKYFAKYSLKQVELFFSFLIYLLQKNDFQSNLITIQELVKTKSEIYSCSNNRMIYLKLLTIFTNFPKK